jgi:hypothetical protein
MCIGLFLVAMLPAVPAGAEPSLSKKQLDAVVRLEAVTIPTPGEFFVAIDKQGQPNWTQLFDPKSAAPTSSRERMALVLGILVADGYIAVEAQNSQAVKNIGRDIINLAKKLNVSQSILGRGNSLSDFAGNNDWSALREELEATQNEVKLAMAEQKDRDLVILVTLGAWIRGTDVTTSFVSRNFSPQLAELVRQPAIVQYFLDQIAELPENTRTDPLILSTQAGLSEILGIVIADPAQPLSEAAVGWLAAITSGLVNLICDGGKQTL